MDEDVTEVIRRFGERDEIVLVHLCDVQGTMAWLHETFVDQGHLDEYKVATALSHVGFDGIVVSDPIPEMEGDTDWGHSARGYTIGYLRGLFRVIRVDRA